MIPKVIHYCWFGRNPLPKSALKCIESWKKYMPDYEIKEWNEDNFDVNRIPYTAEAYRLKKYAFVSDYARFWILYNYGGLYFDTDVEIIKKMDRIVDAGPFIGCERISNPEEMPADLGVNAGLGLGAPAGLPFFKTALDYYHQSHYLLADGSVSKENVVTIVSDLLSERGLKNIPEIQEVAGIKIYPKEYFCPLSNLSKELKITSNTYSIHWYDGTWLSGKSKLAQFIKMKLGEGFFDFCCKVQRIVKFWK